jgi:hypothetical protein
MTKRSAAADSGKKAEQQLQQQAGFLNGYSHFAKVEDAAKGEVRITVSVFAENSDIAVSETIKSYKMLKGALPKTVDLEIKE